MDILCMCVEQIIKVFSEDGVGKVVEVPADMTARDVCQFLVYKTHCLDDNCWSLVEHHSLLGLGKPSHHTCLFLHLYDLFVRHTPSLRGHAVLSRDTGFPVHCTV